MFNIYSLHYASFILIDMVKLQELWEVLIKIGQREMMCFLYTYWCCCFTNDTDKAL
ncbi:hypothetical protein [Clostridium ganghwense]|uniref:Uncharacterized protein n=1 Tax=Clostridium ganghwense TaxID=312089 RepID=A0ABT4CQP0_9CLOT|nr:hypothetical protein [Clostridium ganghwense]MCY6371238.1 hypothetical protein [Clostridium ganghwense]